MKNTKNFKKFTAVLLAVIFAFSIFTAVTIGTNAAEEATEEVSEISETSGDFYYYDTTDPSSGKVDGSIVIAGYDGSATDLTIPSTIDGRKVCGIGSNAFEDCKTLRSVTIPNGITEIDRGAFKDCTNLRNITIPDSVTSIGDYAFKNCKNLENIAFPDSVASIGEDAFDGTAWYNNQLDGLVYAGKVAYKYKGDMPKNASVMLKNGTKGIAAYAFSGYENLVNINIPGSITSIGEGAFQNCTGITSLTVSDSLKDVSNSAFYNCKIKELIIAEGSKKITKSMLISNTIAPDTSWEWGSTKNDTVESVVIPDGVETIENYAFMGYSALKSITIPDSVTSIGSFYGCTNLSSVTIGNGVTDCSGSFYNCPNLKILTISDSVTSAYWDNNCKIEQVIIADGSKTVNSSMIPNTVKTVTIPDSVTSIGDSAFSGCDNLASIDIPDNVTSIGDSAFSGCDNLASINIPDSVTSIGNNAFFGCNNLVSIDISNNTSYLSENGVLYNKNKSKIFKYPAAKAGESYTIPNSVKVIDDYAFESCKNLKKVTIPESVVSIGENAFSNCSGLTIYGYADSTAEIYALKHNINFVELKAEPTTPTTPTNPTEPTTPTTPTTSTTPTDPVTPTKIGDVNGDGKVDINDATTVQKGIAQLITLNEAQMKVADVTGDGKVDINDVTTIQKFIAKLIAKFPVNG